ncbi:MAG TPA: LysR family transcriptional regulator [Novosphingobium sp.]|nr:LysR family transcriptional regulator [Novosphingobium sp.]
MPTFRQLEIFVEASRDGNFRKTSERLGVSQPAISSQIIRLEQELGCKLFDRRRGGTPSLTAVGSAFLDQARATLDVRRSFPSAPPAGETPQISLKLSVRHFMFEHTLRPALQDFLDRHPQVDLECLVQDSTQDMLRALETGEAHIGMYRGRVPPVSAPLHIEVHGRYPCYLFAHPRLARELREGQVTLSDMPFVLPRFESELEKYLMDGMAAKGIVPRNIVGRSQFATTLSEWVQAGRGVSPLLLLHMRNAVAAGTVEMVGPPIGEWCSILMFDRKVEENGGAAVLNFLRGLMV